IQRALVVTKGDAILQSDLPAEIIGGRITTVRPGSTEPASAMQPSAAGADVPSLARALFQWARKEGKLKVIPAVERELIIQALIETQGNQVQAAKLLGITRATLRKRVNKFSIKQELAIK